VASARIGARFSGREEVGLGLERRRAGAGGQVEEGRRRADGVGQGHQRTAVQRAADRRQRRPVIELRHHALRRRLHEANAEVLRERSLVHALHVHRPPPRAA